MLICTLQHTIIICLAAASESCSGAGGNLKTKCRGSNNGRVLYDISLMRFKQEI